MKKTDTIFVIPILLLSFNLVYRLINAAKIIHTFPLDKVNDLSAYIALVYFFDLHGYLGYVPEWFNGFTLFSTYPPGWVFYVYPFYKIFGDLLLGTYLSLLALYVLAFFGIYLIGKELHLSKIKILAFCLFVYANPMIIGAVLKQGRLPSFFGFILFTYLVYFALYFKDKPLDWKVLFFIFFYFALLITHQAELVLASVFLLGFFMIKNTKERIILVLALFFAVLLASFWLVPFIQGTLHTGFLKIGFAYWVWDFQGFFWNNIVGLFLSLALCVIFYRHYRFSHDRRFLLFYLPVVVLAVFYFLRVTPFIPLLKYVYPDPYNDFFLFFLSLFFITFPFRILKPRYKTILAFLLVFLVLAGVIYNFTITPFFVEHTEEEEHFLELVPQIEGKFFMMSSTPVETYSKPYYTYALIYYNISSIDGWGEMYKEYDYTLQLENSLVNYFENPNCDRFIDTLQRYNTTELLTYGFDCSFLVEQCHLIEKASSGDACLLYVS